MRQLGSIYEGLLESHLEYDENEKGLIVKGDKTERKATGTYYTPDYIVWYIINHTVKPLCEEIDKTEMVQKSLKEGKHDNSFAENVLKLKVLDPAMGSGHFLVRTTEYLAELIISHHTTIRQYEKSEGGLSQEWAERAYWRRRVAESCIYGVDLNPLAVELAKLSIWLTCIHTQRPLNFLDHHLKTGNSLIGAKLEELGSLSKKKTDQTILTFGPDFVASVGQAISKLDEIESEDSVTFDGVAHKKALWEKYVRGQFEPYSAVADLWTAKHFGAEISENEYDRFSVLITKKERSAKENKELKELKGKHVQGFAEAQKRKFFHWELEFPEVFFSVDGTPSKNAGFDAVIGNPPYKRELDFKDILKDISLTPFGEKYKSPRMDLWYYFVHRGIEYLKNNGVLSFIVNAYWLAGSGAEKLIKQLKDDVSLAEIFYLGKLKVFPNVSGQHLIFRISKLKNKQPVIIKTIPSQQGETAEDYVKGIKFIKQIEKDGQMLFKNNKINIEEDSGNVLATLENNVPLFKLGIVRQGIAENPSSINKKTNIKFGNKWKNGQGVFMLTNEEVENLHFAKNEIEIIKPYHDLVDLGRYFINDKPAHNIIYSTKKTCPDINVYPGIREHLEKYKPIMMLRRETKKGSNSWWHLHWPREEKLWTQPKIVAIQMGVRPSFVASVSPNYVSFSANVFVPFENTKENIFYISALLNSRLMWYWFKHNAKRRGVGLEINGNVLGKAPICKIDFKNNNEEVFKELVIKFQNVNKGEIITIINKLLQNKHLVIVHDFLSFMAQQMIEMKKQEHGYNTNFTNWLEREITKTLLKILKDKTKIYVLRKLAFLVLLMF